MDTADIAPSHDFQELHELIPDLWWDGAVATLHSQVMTLAEVKADDESGSEGYRIEIACPGKHSVEGNSRARSGDFVIRVSCGSISGPWERRQFTHNDLLRDVAAKTEADATWVREHLLPALCEVVKGDAPPMEATCALKCPQVPMPGLEPACLLALLEALSLCEHRRYGHKESAGGGKWLPLKFISAVAYGWSLEATEKAQKLGLNGYAMLAPVQPRVPDLATICREAASRRPTMTNFLSDSGEDTARLGTSEACLVSS